MGQARKRRGSDGKPRYTAYYQDLRGRRRSVGTFATRRDADRAWQRAEVQLAEGRVGDPRRGRQTFERNVREEWLPNHVMELRTGETYTLYLERVLLPTFGPMRMIEILPFHVRKWVKFQQGMAEIAPRRPGQRATISNSASVIESCMVILSAIFTTALNDQVIYLHPCKGIKTSAVAKKIRQIITPEQFDLLYDALPDSEMKLLVESDIESGLRWGELIELRVHDLDRRSRTLTVSRVAVEVSRQFRINGQRFVVKEYPKDEEHRQLRLSTQISDKIAAHIDRMGLAPDDLIFALRDLPARAAVHAVTDPAVLGLTGLTRRASSTGTARSAPTTPPLAAAETARTHTRSTGHSAAPAARMSRANPRRSLATDTSHDRGSAPLCGSPPERRRGSPRPYDSTTCATPMPRGCSPAAPTSRSSRNASDTAAS
jgi:hypothetical protein